jgi:hypothetical protein
VRELVSVCVVCRMLSVVLRALSPAAGEFTLLL